VPGWCEVSRLDEIETFLAEVAEDLSPNVRIWLDDATDGQAEALFDRLVEVAYDEAHAGVTVTGAATLKPTNPPHDQGLRYLAELVKAVRAVQAARRDLSHHHAHSVPGRWDKDGSVCDVCVRVGAMDDALRALEATP
jgi:hypothetical protein